MKIVYYSDITLEADLCIVHYLSNFAEVIYLSACRTDKKNRWEIKHLPKLINRIEDIENVSDIYLNFLRQASVYLIKDESDKKILKCAKNSFKLFQFIREIAPDYILSNSSAIISWFFSLKYRNKLYLFIHDPILHSGYEKKYGIKIKRKLLFPIVKHFILFNDTQTKEFIQHYKIKKATIDILFLGEYSWLREYQCTINKKNNSNVSFLFFGTFTKYKGINILIKAYKKYHRYNNRSSLVIAGSGPQKVNIETGEDSIHLINKFISNIELIRLIKKSDIVVCPYLDATQSGVVMTAFALQCPVIATNVGDLPNMVKNGITGIVITANSISELFNAMKVAENKSLLSTFSHNIKEMYQKIDGERGWNTFIYKLIKILDSNYDKDIK